MPGKWFQSTPKSSLFAHFTSVGLQLPESLSRVGGARKFLPGSNGWRGGGEEAATWDGECLGGQASLVLPVLLMLPGWMIRALGRQAGGAQACGRRAMWWPTASPCSPQATGYAVPKSLSCHEPGTAFMGGPVFCLPLSLSGSRGWNIWELTYVPGFRERRCVVSVLQMAAGEALGWVMIAPGSLGAELGLTPRSVQKCCFICVPPASTRQYCHPQPFKHNESSSSPKSYDFKI